MRASNQDEDHSVREAIALNHEGDEPSPQFSAMWAEALASHAKVEHASPTPRAWPKALALALVLCLIGLGVWLGMDREQAARATLAEVEQAPKLSPALATQERAWDERADEPWQSPTDFLLAESEQMTQWSVEEPLESWQIWQDEQGQGAEDEERDL